jgi:outer membrane immunogenic protein
LHHGVALLRGISTPSLAAQGGQRLPSYFNIGRDIPFSVGATSNMDYFVTVRGRLGFAMDRALIYGTGGFAWAHNNATVNIAAGPFSARLFDDKDHTGWTAGGGIEWAFTNNWSAKVEYLYMDLGSKGYTFVGGLPPVNVDLKVHTAKIGLNYKFSLFGL